MGPRPGRRPYDDTADNGRARQEEFGLVRLHQYRLGPCTLREHEKPIPWGADHVCGFIEQAQSIVSDALAAPLAPALPPMMQSFTPSSDQGTRKGQTRCPSN